MDPEDALAFEVVTLAGSFRRGRAFVAEFLTPAVTDLYDAVVTRADWIFAADLADQAFAIASALREDPDLAARYRADVESGALGFGAGEDDEIERAIAEVRRRLTPLQSAPPPDETPLESAPPDDISWPMPPPSMAPPPPMAPPPSMGPPPPAAPPSDGLLGGGPDREWTPSPPAAESPDADIVDSWLNAEIDETALAPQEPALLAVHFGERSTTGYSAAVGIPVAAGAESVDVTVRLVSADVDVPAHPQTLTVGRDGRSRGRALFEIVPRHDGPSELSVLVDVQGNFLQRLDLRFDIGGAAPTEAVGYGRPAGAAAVLGARAASLQIKPMDFGYQLIAPAVSPDPIEILITPPQLAARIEDVRTALLNAVRTPRVALELTIAPEDSDALLRDLSFAGFRLFQALFAGPKASPALLEAGRWLRESLSGEVTTLQVVSDGFPVPWPLMYLARRYDEAPPAWENFIGMRHVVEQVPLAHIDMSPPAPTIESAPELGVRVIFNDGIDAQMPSKPVAAQRAYWAARGVALAEGTTAEHLIRTALAAGAQDKLLYLYCHAAASDDDPDDARLILTGSESVTLGHLWVHAPREDRLDGHPLVFLNACESADMSPVFYDGFVQYFLTKGARGVIGTECKTPGRFAAEWATAFFDELFSGRPVGEAVLGLRRRFLAEHNNPLGLLYGVYCDADTVVAPALPARP